MQCLVILTIPNYDLQCQRAIPGAVSRMLNKLSGFIIKASRYFSLFMSYINIEMLNVRLAGEHLYGK